MGLQEVWSHKFVSLSPVITYKMFICLKFVADIWFMFFFRPQTKWTCSTKCLIQGISSRWNLIYYRILTCKVYYGFSLHFWHTEDLMWRSCGVGLIRKISYWLRKFHKLPLQLELWNFGTQLAESWHHIHRNMVDATKCLVNDKKRVIHLCIAYRSFSHM